MAGLLLVSGFASSVRAEPTVLGAAGLARVLDAARREAGPASAGSLARLSRRARLAGLVPRLRLGLRRGQQYDLYRDLSFDVGNARSAEDEHLTLDATAVFELDRLVFAPEQVRLARLQRSARREAEARVREVISLVFRLERCWAERRTAAETDPDLELEIVELVALVDVLTGGEFASLWWDAVARQPPAARPAAPARVAAPDPPH